MTGDRGGPGERKGEIDLVLQKSAEVNSLAADVVEMAAELPGQDPHLSTPLRSIRMDLVDVYRETARALDTVERLIDDDVAGVETPRSVISEHSDRIKEQYDGTVLNLGLMLLEANRRKWLHRKNGTNGADSVRRHGLTENQRSWLNELQDLLQASSGQEASQ